MSDQAAINELTERLAEAKATIAALRSTERRYQPIFQAMDEGYLLADVLFDEAGRAIDIEYVEANPAATRMVGVDLTGKRLREVSPNYEEYWYEIWGYVAMTGEGQRLERFASPEGIWYDFYVFKPHPNDADSRRIAVLFQDVTRRKLAEIALRKSEARMRAVLQQAPLAIVFTGPSGDIQFRNAMFDELWGRPAHVTTAETYSEHYEGYHLDGRPVASEEWPGARAVLQGETVNDEVLEIVKSDGSRIPCWYAAGPIRDERGEISGGVVLFRDVSEERRTQVALRESEERQAFLLQLSDILRPLSDPDEIQHAAMKLLAEHYDVMRAGYLDVHADGDTMTMAAHFERGATPAPPQIRLSDYGPDLVAAFHAGCTRHVRDTIAEAETEEQRAAYRVLGVYAWIIAPLV
ncbi:MAG: PAS domain-containing protein, partial [Terriglobus roseus]|nr:PAS domain-containing protein [Terriglobus roseus]